MNLEIQIVIVVQRECRERAESRKEMRDMERRDDASGGAEAGPDNCLALWLPPGGLMHVVIRLVVPGDYSTCELHLGDASIVIVIVNEIRDRPGCTTSTLDLDSLENPEIAFQTLSEISLIFFVSFSLHFDHFSHSQHVIHRPSPRQRLTGIEYPMETSHYGSNSFFGTTARYKTPGFHCPRCRHSARRDAEAERDDEAKCWEGGYILYECACARCVGLVISWRILQMIG
jgi:hypothetical protein